MGVMGWSNTAMAARYQHVIGPVQRDIAGTVGGLIWPLQRRDHRTPRLELRPNGERRAAPQWRPGVLPGQLAVAVGFEPTEACTSHAFEACSFGRSDTLPPS